MRKIQSFDPISLQSWPPTSKLPHSTIRSGHRLWTFSNEKYPRMGTVESHLHPPHLEAPTGFPYPTVRPPHLCRFSLCGRHSAQKLRTTSLCPGSLLSRSTLTSVTLGSVMLFIPASGIDLERTPYYRDAVRRHKNALM